MKTNTPSSDPDPQARQLAAILFADIQGYTAMMEADEARALTRLGKFKHLLQTHLPEYHGQIIQYYGDACLAIFNSSVDAVACAKVLQMELLADPLVPVRIGLHVGDVVLRDDNVFGEAVNVASRIESIAVSGSVLLSGSVRNQIKSHREFVLQPLGHFEFKNVEEAIAVYALDSPGLVVPEASVMEGRRPASAPESKQEHPRNSLLLILLLAVIAAVGWGIWYSTATSAVAGIDSSPLSASEREKRLAILPFENQTTNLELDAFGNMLSDWLTRGLMETGEANIINPTNISQQIAQADFSQGADPQFAKATGVDLVLQGRYYLSENQLITVAQIVDITTGKIVHTLQLEGSRDNPIALLDAMTDKLIDFWTVRDQGRFLQKPPKYEAYQQYLRGLRQYTTNPQAAIQHFEAAFGIDSSFYAPLFRVSSLYNNLGRGRERAEIYNYLEAHQEDFTRWEKLTFEGFEANLQNDNLRGAQVFEEIARMDPSDVRSRYNAAFLYNQSNHPRKALQVLGQYDERFLEPGSALAAFWLSQQAFSYYLLEQYVSILQLAEAYAHPKVITPMAVFHLKALVNLDSIDVLESHYEQFASEGVYSPVGLPDQPEHLLLAICNEIVLRDKKDQLSHFTDRLRNWLATERSDPPAAEQPDVFNNGPLRRAEVEGFYYYYLSDHPRALAAWQREQIAPADWADRIERASRVGVCHALLNQPEEARAQLDWINGVEDEHPSLRGHQLYYGVRILAALGRHQEAIEQLRKAQQAGFVFHRPTVFERDPFLQSLQDFPPFQAFIAPKG